MRGIEIARDTQHTPLHGPHATLYPSGGRVSRNAEGRDNLLIYKRATYLRSRGERRTGRRAKIQFGRFIFALLVLPNGLRERRRMT